MKSNIYVAMFNAFTAGFCLSGALYQHELNMESFALGVCMIANIWSARWNYQLYKESS